MLLHVELIELWDPYQKQGANVECFNDFHNWHNALVGFDRLVSGVFIRPYAMSRLLGPS